MDFVETHFGEEELASFKSYFKLKLSHEKDPLVKAGGLQAMLGCFLKHNKEVFKTFKAHLAAKEDGPVAPKKKAKKEESESSEEEEKPKKKAAAAVGKKRTEREESSEESSSEEESSEEESSSSSSSSEDEKPKKKPAGKKGEPTKRQRSDSVSSRTRSHSDVKDTPYVPPPAPKVAPVNYSF